MKWFVKHYSFSLAFFSFTHFLTFKAPSFGLSDSNETNTHKFSPSAPVQGKVQQNYSSAYKKLHKSCAFSSMSLFLFITNILGQALSFSLCRALNSKISMLSIYYCSLSNRDKEQFPFHFLVWFLSRMDEGFWEAHSS